MEESGTPAVPPARRRRIVAAATAAGVVEWYDFSIFATASALVFGTTFFSAENPVTGILASFVTFFVGFGARPIGGLIAGHWGDRVGRKPVLVTALYAMGAATLLIGLLPAYTTIGLFAPLLLVVLRVVQGLAVGAMWGGATLLVTEYAPAHRRGLYGSMVTIALPIGIVLANGVFLVISAIAPGPEFLTWGWRIPFVLGGVIIVLGWYIHRAVPETPEFRRAAADAGNRVRVPLAVVLRHHPGNVALAAASFLVGSTFAAIQFTGLLDYGTRVLSLPRQTLLTIALVGSILLIPMIPVAAVLSDRYGRLRVYLAGAVLIVLWAVPYFWLVDSATVWGISVAVVIGMVVLAPLTGPQATLFAELFPPEVRYTGASLAYQISGLAGGLTPIVMVLLLQATGTSLAVAALVVALGLVTMVCIGLMYRRARHHGGSVPTEPRLQRADAVAPDQ